MVDIYSFHLSQISYHFHLLKCYHIFSCYQFNFKQCIFSPFIVSLNMNKEKRGYNIFLVIVIYCSMYAMSVKLNTCVRWNTTAVTIAGTNIQGESHVNLFKLSRYSLINHEMYCIFLTEVCLDIFNYCHLMNHQVNLLLQHQT